MDSVRGEYLVHVKALWDGLMGSELMLVNSIEGMVEEYERRLGRWGAIPLELSLLYCQHDHWLSRGGGLAATEGQGYRDHVLPGMPGM